MEWLISTVPFRASAGWAPWLFALPALLLLAGCASGPQSGTVSDWSLQKRLEPSPATPSVPSPEFIAPAPVVLQETPPRAREWLTDTWVPLARWCQTQQIPAPQHAPSDPAAPYLLRLDQDSLALHAGSRVVRWRGMDLHLGLAPQATNGDLLVHGLDLLKSLEPLRSNDYPVPAGRAPIVILDPGHGGTDSGASSTIGNWHEKDYTLDWARRAQAILLRNGWQAVLTRTNDVDMAISNRVAFAESCQGSLFVSLHFNSAAPDHGQTGIETYCLTPMGLPSTVTRSYSDEVNVTYDNNQFDAQNLSLAWHVHREVLRVNGAHDRGIRRARFMGVLRGQRRPAILVEGGFLSNPAEARRVGDSTYRQHLAEALAAGIMQCAAPRDLAANHQLQPDATPSIAPASQGLGK